MSRRDREFVERIEKLKRIEAQGYKITANGFIEHREICRKVHGPFPPEWVVHHIDFNRTNNSPENLIALPNELHQQLHRLMRRDRVKFDRAYIQNALAMFIPAVMAPYLSNHEAKRRRKNRNHYKKDTYTTKAGGTIIYTNRRR